MPKQNKPIAVLDIETDPFKHGRTPAPFAIEIYGSDFYHQTWGDNCIQELIEWIEESITEPHIIYVHNGGGFDFWYLQQWIDNPLFFIGSKIAKCGFMGTHELRDSYKLIPVPLAAYQKDEIDYSIFEYPEREKPKNKKEIKHYLHMDCVYLFELVNQFIDKHGFHLTQASAAMSALKKLHPQKHQNEFYDEHFRPFYFGGRTECFDTGEVKGDFKIYDVNSMYPFVMGNYLHPLNGKYKYTRKLSENKVAFFECKVKSNGALPVITKHGLAFPHGTFDCLACSHELIMGIKLNVLKILSIKKGREFLLSQTFTDFVDKYSMLKIQAEENNDKGGRLFAKLLLNSAYGKFGQNPRNYKDCMFFDDVKSCKQAGYIPQINYGDRIIGSTNAELKSWSFNDVAIAASITSAARAELMKGLIHSTRPVYCDTDSIICEHLNAELHDTKLGAWKCEGEFDTIYIGGKKLYACFVNDAPLLNKGTPKKASKGVNLSPELIKKVAMGEVIDVAINAPTLRPGQDAKFITRKIQKTS